MDRLLDDGVGLQLDERAVPDERRIERRESVILERRDLAEVTLGSTCSGANRVGETVHPNLLSKPGVGRKILRELAVHEDERVPRGLAKRETREIGASDHPRGASFRRHILLARHRRTKRPLGYRRYAGEVPVLVLGRRKSKRVEAGHSLC